MKVERRLIQKRKEHRNRGMGNKEGLMGKKHAKYAICMHEYAKRSPLSGVINMLQLKKKTGLVRWLGG